MKNKFDISDFVDYLTEEKVIKNLVNRVIARIWFKYFIR